MHAPTLPLRSGSSIPLLGFGTWKLEGSTATKAVAHALNTGYRHVDTADVYGNHREVGEALKQSTVEREDIFLTTKVWRDHFHDGDLQESAKRLLGELQVEYVDLLLLHWPNKDVPLQETIGALQAVKDEGLTRAIGVSNFTVAHLKEAQQYSKDIAVNQVEFHPTLRQNQLLQYCQSEGIVLTAYSPLGRTEDLDHPVVQKLVETYERSASEIILAWLRQKGIVAIPKASSSEHIEQNFQSLDFELPEEDIATIEGIEPSDNRLVVPPFAEFNRED